MPVPNIKAGQKYNKADWVPDPAHRSNYVLCVSEQTTYAVDADTFRTLTGQEPDNTQVVPVGAPVTVDLVNKLSAATEKNDQMASEMTKLQAELDAIKAEQAKQASK